jgi:hypothetical protein
MELAAFGKVMRVFRRLLWLSGFIDSRLNLDGKPAQVALGGQAALLVFAGQHQHLVCEVEGNFDEWEIGELDFLGEDDL